MTEQPLREHLHGQLMLALYRSERQAEALEAYRNARRTLVDEIGVEPGTELRALQDAILAQDPALDLRPVVDELPPALDGGSPVLVGRERELAELGALLADAAEGRGGVVLVWDRPVSGRPGWRRSWRGRPCACGWPSCTRARRRARTGGWCWWSTSSRRPSPSAGTSQRGASSSRWSPSRASRSARRRGIAMRADFYARCAAHAGLARLVGGNQVLVGPMNATSCAARSTPARRAGLLVEQALTDTLIADVLDEPGGLPLLSPALLELWRERDGRVLASPRTRRPEESAARSAVGRGDLQEAERAERQAARRILLRLADAGEQEATFVRRRVPLDELDP